MLKSKFTLVGIIIIIFSVFMQYRGGIFEWAAFFEGGARPGGSVEADAAPPIASGYIKSTATAAAQPSTMKPFKNEEFEKLSDAIGAVEKSLLNMSAVVNIGDYHDDCINIFATKITSSKEHGMRENEADRQAKFKVIFNSTDIEYAGYYSTPKGMAAIIKVRKIWAGALNVGDTLSNSNLKLKALNERCAVFENMSSREDEKVNIIQR
ncbi:MAG: hypothetical protein A2008_01610 [Candidatus Wallbacteria bacterium GWC2_49_35]|uniref:Uncharacterized protein n=1 Tax=Candidatus Wallbacteria bacterium GWC2_49_35 TaxID=1817813 RepID=A0A1F7WSA1_9BACT|nr:MAG: hypothetical protein A2008_01610 [Candidatus Wallbacteria bacterium GWC2_49_35]